MILRKHHRIRVFGITGKQGSFWSNAMISYGARVVGGVNPRKPGITHLGVRVFASARDASSQIDSDAALLFVPPMAAKSAILDACEAGIKMIICLTEHIPLHDVMEALAVARAHGARVFGPNTAGLVTPGETFAGIMPAFNDKVFRPGRIGVISRSGSLGALVCLELTASGLGQSAFLGVGGDPVIGTSTAEALRILDTDDRTDAVVVCGEIGGAAEEEAAAVAARMQKPVAAFIAGRSAPPGRKMGHAGAIITGSSGSYAGKRNAFEKAGVKVADIPSQIPRIIACALSSQPPSQ